MEPEPRVVFHEGEAVHEILHAWGTNGVITRIWLALARAVDWSQCVAAFDTFDAAFDFSEKIATGKEWTKRLVTTFEWPIPSFFTPIIKYAPEGKSLIFFLKSRQLRLEPVHFFQYFTGLSKGRLTQSFVVNHQKLFQGALLAEIHPGSPDLEQKRRPIPSKKSPRRVIFSGAGTSPSALN